MRILRIVTRPNLGGPMRQAVALWHACARQGARTLLAVGACDVDETAIEIARTGIPVLPFGEALRRGPEAVGLTVVPGLGRRVAPWRDLAAGRALRALCRNHSPDVVHTHTSKAGAIGRAAAHSVGIRVVAHTFHGIVLRDYAPAPLEWLARVVERRLAQRSHLLFAVSESCRQEIVELGVADDVRVVLPAVPTAAFASSDRERARERLGLREGQVALGFVGRLVPVKRPEMFAALVAALPKHVEGFVIGEGPLRARLSGSPRIRLLGATEEPESFVPGFDLLVSTSRREGFPVAAVEAAAAGVPTIGFDVPGVRDVIRATRTGLLVPSREGVLGLARRVRDFLEAGAPRLSCAGQELAQRCDPDAVAAELLAAYRERGANA